MALIDTFLVQLDLTRIVSHKEVNPKAGKRLQIRLDNLLAQIKLSNQKKSKKKRINIVWPLKSIYQPKNFLKAWIPKRSRSKLSKSIDKKAKETCSLFSKSNNLCNHKLNNPSPNLKVNKTITQLQMDPSIRLKIHTKYTFRILPICLVMFWYNKVSNQNKLSRLR